MVVQKILHWAQVRSGIRIEAINAPACTYLLSDLTDDDRLTGELKLC